MGILSGISYGNKTGTAREHKFVMQALDRTSCVFFVAKVNKRVVLHHVHFAIAILHEFSKHFRFRSYSGNSDHVEFQLVEFTVPCCL